MVLYNSYIKSSENGAIDDLVLLKNGISYTAFFLGILWFLYHRMWKESAILFFLGWILCTVSEKTLSHYNVIVVSFGLYLLVAINASYWYAKYLQGKKYQFSGCVFGKNREMAKLRFIENYLAKNPDSNELFSESILNPLSKKKNRIF